MTSASTPGRDRCFETGKDADKPVMHNANLFGLTPEAIVLPEGNAKWDANTEFGLISDNGTTMFDNNILGKDQAPLDKQSRIDYVRAGRRLPNGYVFKELTGTRRQDNLEGRPRIHFYGERQHRLYRGPGLRPEHGEN